MRTAVAGLAAALALQAGLAMAQGAPHLHGGHRTGAAPEPKEAPAPMPKAAAGAAKPAAKARPEEARGYDSAFADYRPFDPQEPAKPWRAANEEVREAGGHIGVMKAIEAAKAAPGKDGKP